MHGRWRAAAVAMVVAAVGLAGCSTDEYSRDEAVADLVEQAGLSRAEARCVVDGIEGEIDPAELPARREPSREERQAAGEIVARCTATPTTSAPARPL